MSKSLIAYLACCSLLIASSVLYYPKWNKVRTEATISWDVSGYYFYLPAIFIYQDLKQLGWQQGISRGYDPGPGYQAFDHPGGNKVMKYSAGLAVQYLPFFLIAHWLTPLTDYPADGFSLPYQLAISLGSLLVAILGLWLLRIVLRRYFSENVVALVLVTITFATNYLDYAGINSAMSHNYLFTEYALLILLSDNYWKSPKSTLALAIGALVGLMALTRPTEIVAFLIPLLWGVQGEKSMQQRVLDLRKNWRHFLIAGAACLLIGSIQLIYWKFVSGDWIVYSYEDQGFSWLSPHILNGMFSYRSGWLVYTPVMVLSLIGFYFLYRRKPQVFYATAITSGIFMYITWAWDVWWYGGSLGQRAMVQLYPVLAFALTASFQWLLSTRALKYLGMSLLAICVYYNLWLTHQAHRGGLVVAGEMNKAYFWKILGRYDVAPEARFLLDNSEVYRGKENGVVVFESNFEDSLYSFTCELAPISGSGAICVGPEHETSGMIKFSYPAETQWLRATATFRGEQKEWDTWIMTQFRIHLIGDGNPIKSNGIRIHRVLKHKETRTYSLDIRIPDDLKSNSAAVEFQNFGSPKPLLMDDLMITAF